MSRPGPDNRDDAVALCEAGFAIFPLLPASKFPAIGSPHPQGSPQRGRCRGECGQLGHGFYDACADADWADRYWTAHPDHGIGARPGPDQIVLDVDPRHGGDAALAVLEDRHVPLPETFTAISGRGDGGRHQWFTGVQGSVASRLRPGVDLISHAKGYVVMPPSLHPVSRQPYRLQLPVAAIAQVPPWLLEMIGRPAPAAPMIRNRFGRRMSPGQARGRARGLLATVAGASRGERHKCLYWATSRAAEDGLLHADGLLATALADAAADAGLYPDEIDDVIIDAVLAADRIDGGW